MSRQIVIDRVTKKRKEIGKAIRKVGEEIRFSDRYMSGVTIRYHIRMPSNTDKEKVHRVLTKKLGKNKFELSQGRRSDYVDANWYHDAKIGKLHTLQKDRLLEKTGYHYNPEKLKRMSKKQVVSKFMKEGKKMQKHRLETIAYLNDVASHSKTKRMNKEQLLKELMKKLPEKEIREMAIKPYYNW